MFVCECICMCVVSDGAQTRRLSSTSPSLAGWPVAGGGRGTGAATTIMCFGRRGWTGWTAAAAGSRRGRWRCPLCPTTSPSRALLLPLPALAAAHALSLLPLCPAHGGWRCLGKHLGMDFSLSSSGHSLWALPGCCGRGAGCWTWIRLCNFQTGPAGGGCEEGPQPTDLLTLSSLSPLYSTPWQLPHLLLPPASLCEAKLCSVMVLHIPSKTVDQTLPP